MVRISSTRETEHIFYGDKEYKWYPKIRDEYIGMNTSDTFIDTVNISNLYLNAINGDYDGDQVGVKGVYTKEANDELIKHITEDKSQYIDISGINIRTSHNEAIQCLYNLTLALPGTELRII